MGSVGEIRGTDWWWFATGDAREVGRYLRGDIGQDGGGKTAL